MTDEKICSHTPSGDVICFTVPHDAVFRMDDSKDLLYSTGDSAPCGVAAWMGGECGGGWIRAYVWLMLSTRDYHNIVHWLYLSTK